MFLVLCTRFYLVPGISKLWIFKRYPDEHCLQLGTSETVRFRSIVNFMVSKSNIVLNSLVMVLSNSSHPKLACLSIVGLSDKDERSTEKSNVFRILVAVVSVAASLVFRFVSLGVQSQVIRSSEAALTDGTAERLCASVLSYVTGQLIRTSKAPSTT